MLDNKKVSLSICIPTFNRANLLKECLGILLPQVQGRSDVDVVVIDNCSPDHTQTTVKEFMNLQNPIRYFRNSSNLGYTGNQIKCFEYSTGEYIAILGDDDIYLAGAVEEILKVINKREYVFIGLNYYSFLKDFHRIHKYFAPEKDVCFEKALDILNYPSIGHYSALVFNAKIAREKLNELVARGKHLTAEINRGILTDIYVRVLATTNLPAYFIGKKLLAARMPERIDYDLLKHLCIDYYDIYFGFYQEGFISSVDLEFRIKLILNMLPKAIIKDLHKYDERTIELMTKKLTANLKKYDKFRLICLPLLYIGKFKIGRCIFFCVSRMLDLKRAIIRKIRQ